MIGSFSLLILNSHEPTLVSIVLVELNDTVRINIISVNTSEQSEALVIRDHSVATPAPLCHKEPASSKHSY